jgi:two-component system chemotaxis response regulator CheY
MIKNTLIIDDDNLSIYLTKTTLEITINCKNFESANSGNQAIDYLKYCIEKNNNFPDLILLDLDMPNGNGWQFIEDFKQIKSKIKHDINIFMLSSTFDKGNIVKAKNCTLITDFISKPLVKQDVEQIEAKIVKSKLTPIYY